MSRESTAEAEAAIDAQLVEIERLSVANRTEPDLGRERDLLGLRSQAAAAIVSHPTPHRFPDPDSRALPPADPLAEVPPAALTPGLVRAAILRDGALIVRGLLAADVATELAGEVQRVFEAREIIAAGGTPTPGYYEEFVTRGPPLAPYRPSIAVWGGALAVDSPRVMQRMIEVFDDNGVLRLAEGYLGTRPILSAHKTTLRRIEAAMGGNWHQDGAFMHNSTALNLWVSLSHCGVDAPGLDIIPARLDHFVVSHEEMFRPKRTAALGLEAAQEHGILRPVFEPGDALFFDEMCLHRTAVEPDMPNPRFALETWFFPASAFPSDYAPLAV